MNDKTLAFYKGMIMNDFRLILVVPPVRTF